MLLRAALALAATGALAQPYANRPVRVIVPYPPGGATDAVSRGVAQKLGEVFGQQFVVDNRAGGGQTIGTALAAKASPDGYTLLLVSVTHSINPGLHAKLPYDSVKDFAPITLVGTSPNVLLLHPGVAARSVKELVALTKSQPGKLNYASSGNGSGGHLAAELFKSMAGITMTHVPYKGGGPAYIDLVAGQVDLMFTSPVTTMAHVKAGRLRVLAVTTAQRSPALPDLPTVAESGYPGYDASLWYGFMAPTGTPRDIITRLHAEIARALQQADLRERLVSQGIDIAASAPEVFSRFLDSEIRKWTKLIREAGIKTD